MRIKPAPEHSFTPVEIVLETQEEVDILFAILNHSYINVPLVQPKPQFYKLYKHLGELHGDGYGKFHDDIRMYTEKHEKHGR